MPSGKVNLAKNSVAFVDDDRVDEPGFYVFTGDHDTTEVDVQDGGEVETDSKGNAATDEQGRLAFVTHPEVVETITVNHEVGWKPTTRVFPSPDGDGFMYEIPEDGED